MITSILRHMTSNRPQLRILVGLMGVALLLASFLAFQVYQAGRGHREAAEQQLRNFASFTAGEWNSKVDEVLGNVVASALSAADSAWNRHGALPVADVGRLVDFAPFAGVEEPARKSLLGYFVIDIEKQTIQTSSIPIHGQDSVTLIQAFDSIGRRAGPSWTIRIEPLTISSGLRVAFVGAIRQSGDVATHAFGWYSDPSFVHLGLDVVTGFVKPLVSSGRPLKEIFVLSVADANGMIWYESDDVECEYAGRAETRSELIPSVFASACVLPGAEEELLAGGWPTTRLPQTLALLGLTACVIIVTMMLIRREAELVRLRADFVAGVSHELRTPLAQIRMFTETLLLGRVRSEAERHRSLEIIDQEAQRLSHLVQNVLMFARSERGHARLTIEPTDVAADVHDALHGFAILTRTKAVDIRPELQEGITLAVDRGALRQVLLNLLDNAVKYGPLGQRITVGLGLFGGNARFWVDDEGPGIAPAERTRVFESFYRIERDALSPIAGSGIGLAIVNELVTLHGGSVWIDEAPGGGARVVVEFPGGYLRPEAAKEGWAVA